jgi:5-hydroxyisourate hydrolase
MISTHVLDTSLGLPAAGVPVRLEATADAKVLGSGVTDGTGRVGELGPAIGRPGNYRLIFNTSIYFAATGQTGLFPEVCVTFLVTDPARHLHIPLLLSPFAYSTYRGS